MALQELVVKALFNKGTSLKDLQRNAEAVAVYDDLLARFGTATVPSLRGLVSMVRSMRDRPRW